MVARKGYKLTEVGEIPEDWEVKKTETVIQEISMGPFGSDIKVSNFILHGVPVLNGSNVRSTKISDIFTNFVSEKKSKSLKKAVASRGDVVITHRGTLGQISYIPKNSAYSRYIISQSQFRVQFDSNLVEPSWVVMFFRSRQGRQSLLEGKGHTGVPALAQPTTKFRQLAIPLPSVEEQRIIATALSDADALIDALEQSIVKKRQIKQGAMQELLTGKRRLPGFAGEWSVKQLGDVGQIKSGGTPSTLRADFWDGEIPWCTPSDLTNLTCSKLLTQTSRSISQYGLKFSSAEIIPKRSLIMTTRATIGECAINSVPMTTNQGFKNIVPFADVNVDFLYYLMSTQKNRLVSLCGGSTFLEIGKTQLLSFEILMPDYNEQTAIANILSDMDDEIAALEAKLAKARQIKIGMMQELLTGRIRLV